MTRPRATVCEVLVTPDMAVEASALLRTAGFTAEALVDEHREQVDAALRSASIPHQLSQCWILSPSDRAQWLEVIRTDSLTPTGNRILAAGEDDVDTQLAAFAALLGESRDNFTVQPVAGWGNTRTVDAPFRRPSKQQAGAGLICTSARDGMVIGALHELPDHLELVAIARPV